ncbi:hypothetical protein GCM10009624_23600 [Gordonia sinesedis]
MNLAVTPLLHAPLIGSRMSKSMAVISYTGRRSGKRFSTPVNYAERDGTITIGVMAPDMKTWWRNFYPDPHPMSIDIGGVERSGSAVAHRDADGGVKVVLTLDRG